MENPKSVKRHLVRVLAIDEQVVADFGFSAEFGSRAQTLNVTLSVQANKTMTVQHMEQMADKMFLDLLKTTADKASEGISSY